MTNSLYLLIYKLLTVLVCVISLWLGLWVYLANRKNRLNQIFVILVLLVSLGISLYYFVISASSTSIAILLAKIGYGVLCVFVIPLYLFFVYFLDARERFRLLTWFIFFWEIFLFGLSVFTDYVVKGVEFKRLGADIVLGKGAILIFLTGVFLVILIIWQLFKKYSSSSQQNRIKIQYFLIGIFIWIFLNFIFNMIFPLVQERNTPFAAIGNFSIIFLIVFTAHAVVKHNLFGLKVILTEVLVASIGIILMILPFLMKTTPLKILTITVFFFFSAIGYLLIKYAYQENEQNEILEQKVKERTQALQDAYENIKKDKTDLERFYRLAVGRELKMVDLKKEIKKLKDELKLIKEKCL